MAADRPGMEHPLGSTLPGLLEFGLLRVGARIDDQAGRRDGRLGRQAQPRWAAAAGEAEGVPWPEGP